MLLRATSSHLHHAARDHADHHRRALGTHYKLSSFYMCLKRPALSGGTVVKARNALSVFRSAGHFCNYVRNRRRPALLMS